MDEIKTKIKTLIELNEIDWEHALNNYIATLIGTVIYAILLFSTFQFYMNNQKEFGILSPIILIFLIQLWIKMLFIIPRPVTSFRVTDYLEK